MATQQTLQALTVEHPACLQIHADIKALIPESDALKLLQYGFTDCSYGNDEVPSFYQPTDTNGDTQILVLDDIDEDYNRISGKISYIINHNARPCDTVYTSILDVINKYEEITK